MSLIRKEQQKMEQEEEEEEEEEAKVVLCTIRELVDFGFLSILALALIR